ncbi:MAG: molecular chaperone DnaJ [Nitrospirota bacterium]
MAAKNDYYTILGVGREASETEIKKAYRKLAMDHHPDRNQNNKAAEERFKEISEAYEALSNPQKRRDYDLYGHRMDRAGFEGFRDFGDVFGDIFSDFFGFSTRGGQRSERGADLRYNLEISLEEAAFGYETRINIPRMETCSECNGRGTEGGTEPATCPNCRGSGQVRFQQGFFTISRTCSKCHGEGRIITHPCNKCRGARKIKRERTLSIKVPPGVETGTRLKSTGDGEAGAHGGHAGDLYVVIIVRDHPVFTRDGNDIYCESPIGLAQAALGTEIEVPTLDGGKTDLKIPDGTQSGTTFRLKGKGIPNIRGYGKGDQIVRVIVQIPSKLNARQRDLLEEYAKISGEEISSGKGFFKKMKETIKI